jgi:predicted AlkP superfamily pyrophosphatase or phosphodiesterase
MVDALGWELLRSRPFLQELCPHRRPLETVLGYTNTCLPTILTGAPPHEHGHLAFYYYAPERSPFGLLQWLELLPRVLRDRGRVRSWISRAVAWAHDFQGYFQLYNMPFRYLPHFDFSEPRDLFEPGGIHGGQPTVFDKLATARVPFFKADWRLPEAERLARTRAAIATGQPRMAWLYLGDLDATMHAHGTTAPQVEGCLARYEAAVRRLVEEAGESYREVRLFLFSDHGMTDTAETCDLGARIEELGLRFGEDYVAAYDSTMARFWFRRDGVRESIEGALRAEPRGRILDDATLARWGCDFPDRRYGELFFLMDPGVLLTPSFMGATPLAGMHGYSPEDARSRAALLSSVPVSDEVRGLADLHPLMVREAA